MMGEGDGAGVTYITIGVAPAIEHPPRARQAAIRAAGLHRPRTLVAFIQASLRLHRSRVKPSGP